MVPAGAGASGCELAEGERLLKFRIERKMARGLVEIAHRRAAWRSVARERELDRGGRPAELGQEWQRPKCSDGQRQKRGAFAERGAG